MYSPNEIQPWRQSPSTASQPRCLLEGPPAKVQRLAGNNDEEAEGNNYEADGNKGCASRNRPVRNGLSERAHVDRSQRCGNCNRSFGGRESVNCARCGVWCCSDYCHREHLRQCVGCPKKPPPPLPFPRPPRAARTREQPQRDVQRCGNCNRHYGGHFRSSTNCDRCGVWCCSHYCHESHQEARRLHHLLQLVFFPERPPSPLPFSRPPRAARTREQPQRDVQRCGNCNRHYGCHFLSSTNCDRCGVWCCSHYCHESHQEPCWLDQLKQRVGFPGSPPSPLPFPRPPPATRTREQPQRDEVDHEERVISMFGNYMEASGEEPEEPPAKFQRLAGSHDEVTSIFSNYIYTYIYYDVEMPWEA